MRRTSSRLAIILLGITIFLQPDLALLIQPAQAQNARYISDQLEIPMRAGTSTKFKILRMLKSGTPVTVIGNDDENGYRKVRTGSGTQGWVLSRYLIDTPSARDSLLQAQEALAPLAQKNTELSEQLGSLQEEKTNVENALSKAEKENERLSQNLSQIQKTSSNAIAIDERNKQLEQQMVTLERQLQLIQQENLALRDDSNQTWFIRGAGVLLFGLLLGIILPRLRLRKNQRWGDL